MQPVQRRMWFGFNDDMQWLQTPLRGMPLLCSCILIQSFRCFPVWCNEVLAKGGTLALSPGQCMHTTLHCAAQASREAHSEVAGAGLLP